MNNVFKIFTRGEDISYIEPWKRESANCTGTGFCIKYEGKKYILTNEHVVDKGIYIRILKYECKVIYKDKLCDLALLDCPQLFKEHKIKPIKIGEAKSGDKIFMRGYPLHYRGLAHTEGTIMRISKIHIGFCKTLVFNLNMSVIAGNSGSPILNEAGECVGVAYAVSWHSELLALAVPFFTVWHFLKSGIEYRKPNFSWQKLNPIMYKNYDLPQTDLQIIEVLGGTNKDKYFDHIEGIPIYEGAQIKITDFLYYLGYKPQGEEYISFQYLISFIDKKEIEVSYENHKFKLPTKKISYPTSNPDYLVYGGYVFVPVSFELCAEYESKLPEGVMIVYISGSNYNYYNSKFIHKIIDIKWDKFIKYIRAEKFEAGLKLVGDNWKFFIDPAGKKETAHTKKLLGLY